MKEKEVCALGSIWDTDGLPGGSGAKESPCNLGDLGLIPESGDPLEKGMATNSSILAWRIPMDRGTCRLQSIGSQRVRHN